MNAPYLRVDVFTDRAFGGNPVAVFPDADAIDTETMHAIAREMNLSETVFCLKPEAPQADVKLRIFTVDRELPLAGHPTVGTVHGLVASGRLPATDGAVVWCELGAGVLPVEVQGTPPAIDSVTMTQRTPEFGPAIEDVALVAAALGVEPAKVCPADLPVRVVNTGVPWCVIPVADLPAMRVLEPSGRHCAELADRCGTDLLYAFTQDVVDSACTAHSRHVWFGTVTPGEDPATGSAAGCLASYLVHEQVLLAAPTAELSIEQGLEIGRPSRIQATVDTDGGRVSRVRVGGSSVLVGDGELRF